MTHNIGKYEFDELLKCPCCQKQIYQNVSNFDCITKDCPIESIKVKLFPPLVTLRGKK